MDNEIGKSARVGDVWYQIMDVRYIYGRKEYRLYSVDYWMPSDWIEKIR